MEGYFMVADLLGFTRLVENLDHDELVARMEGWTSLVQREVTSCGIPHHQLISDTLFAASNDTLQALQTLITLGRSLLEKGIAQGLPVRGAISFGSFEWGSLTYGQAVIEAHRLEQTQDWIGFACSADLPHVDDVWGLDSAICYPVPKRQGHIQLAPAVAWDVPRFQHLASVLSGGGLAKRDEILSWEWGAKLSKTVEFGVYRRLLKKEGLDAKVFRGWLPMQAIELFLDEEHTGTP
jgi:hypothetical protein